MTTTALVLSLGAVAVNRDFILNTIYSLFQLVRFSKSEALALNHASVASTLEELDIEATLEIVESLLREIPNDASETISLFVKIIEGSVKQLQQDFLQITKLLSEHKRKWFSSWRTLDLENNLRQLKIHKSVFNSRMELLSRVITIQRGGVQYTGNTQTASNSKQLTFDVHFKDMPRSPFLLLPSSSSHENNLSEERKKESSDLVATNAEAKYPLTDEQKKLLDSVSTGWWLVR